MSSYNNSSTGEKTNIIFDFDGTLFSLHLDWDKFFDDILYELCILDYQLYKNYLAGNVSWGDMQNIYSAMYGRDIVTVFQQNSSRAEKRLFIDARPNYELLAFINALNPDINLFIWSSNSKEIIEELLYQSGLLKRFKGIVSRSDVHMLKPYHEGFSLIHDGRTDKAEYLMFGNSEADKNAARMSGINFCLVSMGISDYRSV